MPKSEEPEASDSRVIFAFSFLVFVAVTKTLLTKTVFVHGTPPIAFSAFSCVVTGLCIAPVFFIKPSLYASLTMEMMVGFLIVCLAIALDLALTNMAISLLSVALQQCIKATSPAATVLLESMIDRVCHHPLKYLVVLLLCVGPILTNLGSTSYDSTPIGVIAMVIAVVAGAFKYVLAHAMIKNYKKSLGTLAFTFWVEIFVAVMLVPWAYLNGEAELLIFGADGNGVSMTDWALLSFTGAYGGVRIYSQFALLEFTSATTLAASNVAIQAVTIIMGIYLFDTVVTPYLIAGVSTTIVVSALYTWMSLNGSFKQADKSAPLV